MIAVAMAVAGSAGVDVRVVELAFALLLGGCAVGAVVLLGGSMRNDRRQGR
ncbi:hypothetical protein [Kitasatospora brasiliensis]|uniref:hypothetical protein n=1 Tax=Kitasatospora brasiliensis TaxID=3058040 RepID=UPI00292FA4B7|nr:hypothetical protein [Kitasatospora sp. K002]